jgi:hypothetical protein
MRLPIELNTAEGRYRTPWRSRSGQPRRNWRGRVLTDPLPLRSGPLERSAQMWDEDKRRRFDSLRAREAEGKLAGLEVAELGALFSELDAEEERVLSSAHLQSEARQQELRKQNERLAQEVKQLEHIRGGHEQLLTEARSYLNQLRARKAQSADEYRRLTGGKLSAGSRPRASRWSI